MENDMPCFFKETARPLSSVKRQCICEMPEFANSDMPDTDIIEYDPLLDSSNIGVNPGCAS